MAFEGINVNEPSACLKLLLLAPTEEARLKAKSAGCHYSNTITENIKEGRLISRFVKKTYWACFAGPYIALHDNAPLLDTSTTPTAIDYVVLSPETLFDTTTDPNDTSFTLKNIFLNKSTSMKPETTRTFHCQTERQVEEWRCSIQGVVEVLRGDFSLPTAPSQPSAPRVESIKHDAVRLSWNPTTTTSQLTSQLPTLQYYICTRKERDDWSEPILVHSSTCYIVLRDLLPGTQYAWRVCALNVLGQSIWSETSHKVSTLCAPTTSPSIPKIVERGTHTVTLEWNGSTTSGSKNFWGKLSSPVHSIEISAYDINIKNTSNNTNNEYQLVTTQIFNDTVGKCTGVVQNLNPGNTYLFRAAAVSYAGNGTQSKTSTKCKTLGKPESGPTKCKISGGVSHTHDTITIEWNEYKSNKNEAEINGYQIDIEKINNEKINNEKGTPTEETKNEISTTSTKNNTETRTVLNSNATISQNKMTYNVTSLLPNTTYRFRVAATNEVGVGPFCDYGKAVTTMGPFDTEPKSFKVKQTSRTNNSGGTDIGISMKWKKPKMNKNISPMTGYKIYCQQFPSPAVELMVLGPEATELENPLFLEENGGEDGAFSFFICATSILGVGPSSNVEVVQITKPKVASVSDGLSTLPELNTGVVGGLEATMAPVAPVSAATTSVPVEEEETKGSSNTCVVCGAFVAENMKFCGNCGTKC